MGTVQVICASWPQHDTKSVGAAFSDYFLEGLSGPKRWPTQVPSHPVLCRGAEEQFLNYIMDTDVSHLPTMP